MDIRHPHEIYKEPRSRRVKYLVTTFMILMANAGYLFTFKEVSTFYFLNVILHIGIGLILIIPFLIYSFQYLQQDVRFGKGFGRMMGNLGFVAMTFGFICGLVILFRGKMSRESWLFYSHIGFCVFGSLAMISSIRRAGYQISVDNVYTNAGRWGLVIFVVSVMLPILGFGVRWVFPTINYFIHNNDVAKNLMYDLTDEQVFNSFYASPASSSSGEVIDTDFINDSATCGQSGCHTNIYNQWRKSSHRSAALENDWFRSSIAALKEADQQATVNYCSGCHTPGLLLSDEAKLPMDTLVQKHTNKSRIGCNACHATKRVNNTLGNGDYVLQRPRSYAHMASNVAAVRKLFAFKLHVDPEPHNEFFLKPFMTRQNGAFCASCHKINSAIRQTENIAIGAMDTYDSWQKGPFAGERVEAFFPARKHDCTDCHMPRIRMEDPAASSGTVHDHSFNYHVRKVEEANSNSIVDSRYTISPLQIEVVALHTLAKNGEEKKIYAFDDNVIKIAPGMRIEVDVVIHSNEIGHDFPGRFSESIDTWLEFIVEDNLGRQVYRSGGIDDFGRIDPGAEYWGTIYEDQQANRINWPHGLSAQKVKFDRRIAPHTSELVRYKFLIPENCGAELRINAQLKQRNRYHAAEKLLTMKDYKMAANHGNAAASEPEIEIAAATSATISLKKKKRIDDDAAVSSEKERFQTWANYGVALYLQEMWPQAERAFLQAAKLNPDTAEIWINLARTSLKHGDVSTSEIYLDRARVLNPDSEKIRFYQALILEQRGELDAAHAILRDIRKDFYADRVFLFKLAEIQMKRKYFNKASKWYRKILDIAPDDIDAHRGLLQVYKILGKDDAYENESKIIRALENAFSHRKAQ